MSEHSKKYDIVLKYYKSKMWNEARVRNVVSKGWITKEEFTEITGQDY
jgi:hypothetical protein